MIGDKLNIKPEHEEAARSIGQLLLPHVKRSQRKLVVSVAGESGAGKSEIAFSLSQQLLEQGVRSVILQQDDYFVYPPATNARMRVRDIGHVGPSEVKLLLLDQNLRQILDGSPEIQKPLVIYEEDRITNETVNVADIDVVIVEGTYTSLLHNVRERIFIDRTYVDTRGTRKERAREEQDEYLEKILEVEHAIISSHKCRADIIVTRDYEVKRNVPTGT